MKLWIILVAAAALSSLAIAMTAPAEQQAQIPACGENAGWIEVEPGTIACTLKNGKKTGVVISTSKAVQ